MSQDPDKINTLRVTNHRPLRAVAFRTDKVPDEGFVFLGEDIEREDGHLRGTIRTCVGAWGLISPKATHRSSSVREAAEEGFEPSLTDPESVSRHSGLSTAVQKTVYSGQILRFHVSRCSPMFVSVTVSVTVKSARNIDIF